MIFPFFCRKSASPDIPAQTVESFCKMLISPVEVIQCPQIGLSLRGKRRDSHRCAAAQIGRLHGRAVQSGNAADLRDFSADTNIRAHAQQRADMPEPVVKDRLLDPAAAL